MKITMPDTFYITLGAGNAGYPITDEEAQRILDRHGPELDALRSNVAKARELYEERLVELAKVQRSQRQGDPRRR